ncbi:PQQ-binding-like beta-propeller repeat protein [uncultured Cellulomonas sp.]|uniref:outer membrane protein assembly factor BamB family protein n=1 Tax=uncultured Cellulomonas sp. TaxID=189682 RepID=UPI00262E7006|nr:PQQ-binding-like beta-propeller repeat protein [uncultured Cellulomonas sp.]
MARQPGRPRPDLVEVVLAEEPVAAGAPVADQAAAGTVAPTRTRSRRRLAGLAAVLAVVVAVLGFADVVAERRERAALAAVADVPGLVRPLPEPLAELWRLPRRSGITGVPGRVVTVRDDALVGLDASTGEQRWSLPTPDGYAGCDTVPAADGPGTLLCVGVGDGGPPGAGGLVLRPVDATDGAVGDRMPGPTNLVAGAAVEQDVVLVGVLDGRLTVARHALPDGTERWRAPMGDLGLSRGLGLLDVHGDSAVVAVEGATSVVLDARDGREVGRWVGDTTGAGAAVTRVRVVSHPGTGFGVWPSPASGRWYRPDGTPGAALDGEPVDVDVDDGSAPGVVLLRSSDGDRLRGVDVATGRVRWERAEPSQVLMRMGGRVVVVGDDGAIAAWDLQTGEPHWSTPLGDAGEPLLTDPFTDGVRIAVPVRSGDDALQLATIRLADGRRLWTSPLPPGSHTVAVLGDRIVVVGPLDGDRIESVAVLG